MPDRIAASLDTLRDIKQVDNGDGSFSLAVASVGGGGGSSQVEGTQPIGTDSYDNPVNPVVIGYIDGNGEVQNLPIDTNSGLPKVAVSVVEQPTIARYQAAVAVDRKTVGTTPVRIIDPVNNLWKLIIKNYGTQTAWIGQDATSCLPNQFGFPLAAGETLTLDCGPNAKMNGFEPWAVVQSGTTTLALYVSFL